MVILVNEENENNVNKNKTPDYDVLLVGIRFFM